MKLSWTRAIQWVGILAVLVFAVALRYEAPSEAKKTVDAPFESRTDQGMLGYWKFDTGSGTTAIDSSGNGNDLSMTGSPSWTTGNIGPYALDFSGSGQYLSVADPSSGVLDFVDGADFTISGWFNRDTAAADHTIVAKKNDQTTSAGYVVWIDNNGSTDYLSAEISDGTDTYSVIGTTDLSSTGWHHFAVIWDDGTGLYIYLDGKLDGSTTTSTTSINSLANALAFRIGAESDAGVPFDGKIDDVKLYGKALSANDILTLSQTTVPATPASTAGLDSGLVGHWTFDGPDVNWGDTSNEIKDVSGRGNHGDASGLTTASVVRGKLGQGMGFNGSGDYINAGSANSLDDIDLQGGGGMTLSVWLYARGYGESGVVISKDFQNSGRWGFQLNESSAAWRFVKDYSTSGIEVLASPAPVFNVWQHLIVTWDGSSAASNVHFYINGKVVSNQYEHNGSGTKLSDASLNLFIGNDSGGSSTFDGHIDDVRIYSRVLSSTEITNLYNMSR